MLRPRQWVFELRDFTGRVRLCSNAIGPSIAKQTLLHYLCRPMKVLRYTDKDYHEKIEQVASASSLFDPGIEDRARAIVEDVRARGDTAVAELTARFDGAKLEPDQIQVSTSEKFNASLLADEEMRDAVKAAHGNIQAFSKRSLRKNWFSRNRQDA